MSPTSTPGTLHFGVAYTTIIWSAVQPLPPRSMSFSIIAMIVMLTNDHAGHCHRGKTAIMIVTDSPLSCRRMSCMDGPRDETLGRRT